MHKFKQEKKRRQVKQIGGKDRLQVNSKSSITKKPGRVGLSEGTVTVKAVGDNGDFQKF